MKNLKDMLNESRGDIDKDIEKKVKELSKEYDDGETEAKYIARDVASEMTYWMKGYMIERAVEWLSLNAELYGSFNAGRLNDLVENFKKAMEK